MGAEEIEDSLRDSESLSRQLWYWSWVIKNEQELISQTNIWERETSLSRSRETWDVAPKFCNGQGFQLEHVFSMPTPRAWAWKLVLGRVKKKSCTYWIKHRYVSYITYSICVMVTSHGRELEEMYLGRFPRRAIMTKQLGNTEIQRMRELRQDRLSEINRSEWLQELGFYFLLSVLSLASARCKNSQQSGGRMFAGKVILWIAVSKDPGHAHKAGMWISPSGPHVRQRSFSCWWRTAFIVTSCWAVKTPVPVCL